jgi:DNA-binding transcriptional LysR family regulator
MQAVPRAHGSFTAAAQELNVTQAAVSRMVRLLERRLGYALFRRHANALELTAQGEALLSGVTDSFDLIARFADQVAAMRAGPVLTVGVGPALAVNWLIPRLTSFYRVHPDVEVQLATGAKSRRCWPTATGCSAKPSGKAASKLNWWLDRRDLCHETGIDAILAASKAPAESHAG